MTPTRLALISFRHYWRSHLGLFFGVFLAASVLSGSLFVGDSVRASLRRAAAERLGKVESGLAGGDRWFTEDLARKSHAVPMILLSGSVSESSGKARANAVQVLGVDEEFWKLAPQGDGSLLSPGSGGTSDGAGVPRLLGGKDALAVNESLARKLGVKAGDTVLVRLEKPSAISRDAPLSGEANQEIVLRRKVTAILNGGQFGNFQLQASQIAPDNVFLPLSDLAQTMGKMGRINTLLQSNDPRAGDSRLGITHSIDREKNLEDFALKLLRLNAGGKEWEITTDRVFLDDIIAQKILKAVPGSYGVLTYLVNGLNSEKGRTPYSMVTAIPFVVPPSGGTTAERIPREGGTTNAITITQWLADDLQVGKGDKIDIRYFSVGLGRDLKEQTASFTLREILPMTDPAVNSSWAPDFPGVTDAKNCRDWQPGIPMKLDAIRDKDEAYWKEFKTTPKAFISLAEGQKLWSNRFGNLTAIRFPDTGQDEGKLREDLTRNLRLSDIGLIPRDFQAEAVTAAKGSVDFGGLFVGLSLFLVVAALIFSALLLLFTLENRAAQFGLLFSLGWRKKQVRRFVLCETGLVVIIASLVGLLGGAIYTKAALAGLNGAWSGATVGMKLVQAFEPMTLGIAFACSLIVSLGTIWIATRRLFRTQPKDLLAGDAWARRDRAPAVRPKPGDDKSVIVSRSKFRHRWVQILPVLCLLSAIGMSVAGTQATNPEAIAGMFFGSGFCLLGAGLLWARQWITRRRRPTESSSVDQVTPNNFIRLSRFEKPSESLVEFGLRNITRRPGRSLSVIGMMSGGIFLVIAVNAFRLGAEADPSSRSSGTGGFALIGQSTLPVYEDLNSAAARDAFALDEKLMKQVQVVPFRLREGDDASCLNLNKATRPMLCAVNPRSLSERKAFSFAKGSWDELKDGSSGEVAGIADQATAMWGLGKGVGDTLSYTDSSGNEFKVKLAALLAGSVLQGKVVISERDFLARFPDTAGYKFFLIDAPANQAAAVRSHLTQQLATRGLALEPAVDRLAAFNAVQNTYIGIFTVLGGLGVLLGTFGLGVLAMRNVLERRGEFGLMQALGFKTGVLRGMVLSEHAALLVAGLLLGLVSSAIAVWPSVRQSAGAVPWGFLLWINLGTLGFGIAACWFAAWLALRGRLLDAVRRE